MGAHVASHTGAKNVFAEIPLEHAQDRGPLGVGDGIEDVHRARVVLDRRLDRMGRPARVLRQGLVFPERIAQRRAPPWIETRPGPARPPPGATPPPTPNFPPG